MINNWEGGQPEMYPDGIFRRVICFLLVTFLLQVLLENPPFGIICFTDFPSIVTKQIQGMLSSIMWKPSIWILRFLDAQGWGVSHK